MKPIDLRNATWDELQSRITGDRAEVYFELSRSYHPLTARELSARMQRDLNDVAPRLTELCQLGLAELAGRAGKRGQYRAISLAHARANLERAQRPEQLSLAI